MAQFSIQLELRHSYWWIFFRRFYTLVLATALVLMDWPLGYRFAALVILVANTLYVESKPTGPCRFQLEPKGRMMVLVDSAWIQANKVQSRLIHPWLTAFSAEFPNGKVQQWWVFIDSATADDFRRLRVWLQWESHQELEKLEA